MKMGRELPPVKRCVFSYHEWKCMRSYFFPGLLLNGKKKLAELLKINPDIKVIISSGYALDGSLKDILSTGAAAFVPKPFSLSRLLNTVRQVLDQ